MRRAKRLCVCVAAIGCVACLWHLWPNLCLTVQAGRTDFVVVSIDGGPEGVAYWRVDGERAQAMLDVLRRESVPERYPRYAEGSILKLYLFNTQDGCLYCCPIKGHKWRLWLEEMAKTGSLIAESDLDFNRSYGVMKRVFRE